MHVRAEGVRLLCDAGFRGVAVAQVKIRSGIFLLAGGWRASDTGHKGLMPGVNSPTPLRPLPSLAALLVRAPAVSQKQTGSGVGIGLAYANKSRVTILETGFSRALWRVYTKTHRCSFSAASLQHLDPTHVVDGGITTCWPGAKSFSFSR